MISLSDKYQTVWRGFTDNPIIHTIIETIPIVNIIVTNKKIESLRKEYLATYRNGNHESCKKNVEREMRWLIKYEVMGILASLALGIGMLAAGGCMINLSEKIRVYMICGGLALLATNVNINFLHNPLRLFHLDYFIPEMIANPENVYSN